MTSMEPQKTNNKTLTVLFGLYLAAHIILTSLQIYHTHYKDTSTSKSSCGCQK